MNRYEYLLQKARAVKYPANWQTVEMLADSWRTIPLSDREFIAACNPRTIENLISSLIRDEKKIADYEALIIGQGEEIQSLMREQQEAHNLVDGGRNYF